MPTEIKYDRFRELKGHVDRLTNTGQLQRLAERIAGRVQKLAIFWLRFEQPHTTSETFVDTGHKNPTSIADGWELAGIESRIESNVGSARVKATAKIGNTSEHIDAQRDGTESKRRGVTYPIPRDLTPQGVRFWIGPPLKWPVKNAAFAAGGFFRFAQIQHPGFEPWGGRDFAEVAIETARVHMDQAYDDELSAVFKPLDEFFR